MQGERKSKYTVIRTIHCVSIWFVDLYLIEDEYNVHWLYLECYLSASNSTENLILVKGYTFGSQFKK